SHKKERKEKKRKKKVKDKLTFFLDYCFGRRSIHAAFRSSTKEIFSSDGVSITSYFLSHLPSLLLISRGCQWSTGFSLLSTSCFFSLHFAGARDPTECLR